MLELEIERPKGGTRKVRAYGIKHKAKRRIGARILTVIAATKIGENQFVVLPRRGRNKAIDKLIVLIEAKGARNPYKIAYVVDYKSFYEKWGQTRN